MKKITEVTRRDIFDVIQNGFNAEIDTLEYEPYYENQIPSSETEHIYMPFSGRCSTIDFLDRLYHLDEMPSTDHRYKTAKGDIYCHTVSFDDWPEFWFLDDDRFELKDGFDDEPLLKFICEMLHPAVRDEESSWKCYLERFNELLRPDGYEIYSADKISGRDIYKYHEYVAVPVEFNKQTLFTSRYSGWVNTEHGMPVDLICSDVTDSIKKTIISVLVEFSEPQIIHPNRYDSYEITTDAMYSAMTRLNDYHGFPVIDLSKPGYFGNRYSDVLESIFNPFLFDLIEIQNDELSNSEKREFCVRINAIFLQSKLNFIISDCGMIEQIVKHEVLNNIIVEGIGAIKEVGLRDLLDQAVALHQRADDSSHKEAMEKIWDALERLKTYYTGMDKKASATKIVTDMAGGQADYIELFNAEFKALTDIGNNFRIRHHETNKIDITDIRHYDYFFNRCLSLISMAILYLE